MCTYAYKTKMFPIQFNEVKEQYNITSFLNCNAHHVLYFVHCMECELCYIGSTIRKVKTRITKRIVNIKKMANYLFSSSGTLHSET